MSPPAPLLGLLLLACSQFIQPSHQVVDKLLTTKQAAKATCPDCDMMELPNGSYVFAKCDPYDLHKCGEISEKNYDCCVGFQQYREPGDCTSVPKWLQCLEKMGYGPEEEMVALVNEMALLKENDPYTIFIAEGSKKPYHLIKGRYNKADLSDGLHLQSATYKKKQYHVSRFANDTVCLDCVQFVKADQECPDGVVHITKRQLTHPIVAKMGGDKTLWSVLSTEEKTKDFASYLPTVWKEKLDVSSASSHYTVLAPTKSGWNKLKETYTEDELRVIASNHVMDQLHCLDSFFGNASADYLTSANKQKLNFGTRNATSGSGPDTDAGRVRTVTAGCNPVYDIQESDIVTQGGAIHMIDGGLVPDQIYRLTYKGDIPECLRNKNVDKWWNYMKDCDLYIEKQSNYTHIFPVDSAFDWWATNEKFKEEFKRFETDKEYRCETLRYHIMNTGQISAVDMKSANRSVPFRTNNKNDYLYEELYYRAYPDLEEENPDIRFHYSKLLDKDPISFQGSWIYRSDKVNIFPERNVSDIIKSRQDTKIASTLFNKTKMDENFMKNAPKALYLVAKDEGMEAIFDMEGNLKDGDSEAAWEESYVENHNLLHTVPDYLWGSDLGYFEQESTQYFNSSLGLTLTFQKDKENVTWIGYEELGVENWSKVIEMDLPAKDGIVWILDKPIACPPSYCAKKKKLDIDYFLINVAACRKEDLPNTEDAKKKFGNSAYTIALANPTECHAFLVREFRTEKEV